MEKGGEDLFTFYDLYPEGIPEDWIKSIMYNLLKAIHYIHSQSICHRDLKPEV
jgi:cyclin-dependent kinase-like